MSVTRTVPTAFSHAGPGIPPLVFLPEANDLGLVVQAQATADGVGQDSFASTTAQLRMLDRGIFTFAFGTLHAEATALSCNGEIAFAGAQTGVAFSGADLSIVATATATGAGSIGPLDWWSESSTTRFFAIDFEGFRLHPGTIELTGTDHDILVRPLTDIAGNLALYSVDSKTFGADMLNDVLADALTVEDQLASAYAQITLAHDYDAGQAGGRILQGSNRAEQLVTGDGDDLVFARAGNDRILVGEGDNTAFGQSGHDLISAMDGEDWLFGGTGNDTLSLGAGDDLGLGGDGNDVIVGSDGDDILSGGRGHDTLAGGNGWDRFLLGQPGGEKDGNDTMAGGGGGDWFLLEGAFGRDRVNGFSIAEGDRLVVRGEEWSSEQGLRALNGSGLTLQRNGTGDLLVTLDAGEVSGTLILENFFVLNPAFGGLPKGPAFTDAQALPLIGVLFMEGTGNEGVVNTLAWLEGAAWLEILA